MAKRILIVDDEPEIVEVLKNRLSAQGYECLAAEEGITGLEMAKREKPDLIVLDLMLPKMDGYKVCALLKKDMRYHQIPIVMFTARGQKEDEILGKEVGADAYIVKPFDPKTFLSTVGTLLSEEEKGSPRA